MNQSFGPSEGQIRQSRLSFDGRPAEVVNQSLGPRCARLFSQDAADGSDAPLLQAFDELVLLKRGGRTMYAGPTGHNSQKLIDYFQSIPDVPQIQEGINPGGQSCLPCLHAYMANQKGLALRVCRERVQANTNEADSYARYDLAFCQSLWPQACACAAQKSLQ